MLRESWPCVAMLVAPASRPLRARNHHLLTSSITYSCSASHVPEQPTFSLTLPVNSTVPGSTLCQHVRVNGTDSASTAPTPRHISTQSVAAPASRAILSRARRAAA